MKRAPCYPLTVFYDASCPMCATEIHALRDNGPEAQLTLVDCSVPWFDDSPLVGDGIRTADLMARIHVRDSHGRWFVGMDAFEAIYRAVGLERAARLWANPRLRPIFGRLYPWVARHRQALSALGMHLIVRLVLSATIANRPAGSCPRL